MYGKGMARSGSPGPGGGGSPRKWSPRRQQSSNKGPQQRTSTGFGFQKFVQIFLRKHRIWLFMPLLYVFGMLFYMTTLPSLQVPVLPRRHAPGSLYRSPQLFIKLWPYMASENYSANVLTRAWQHTKRGQRWKPCVIPTPSSSGQLECEHQGQKMQTSTILIAIMALSLVSLKRLHSSPLSLKLANPLLIFKVAIGCRPTLVM